MEAGQSNLYRSYFSSVYLMLIGIIQATVFTTVASHSISYIEQRGGLSKVLQTPEIFLRDQALQFDLATLVIVIVVTFEYTTFLASFYRAIRLVDVVIPFMIGFIETWMAEVVDTAADWWLLNIAFSVAGLLAFLNTATYSGRSAFGDDRQRITASRIRLVTRFALTIASIAFTYYAWQSTMRGDGLSQNWLIAIYLGGFGLALLISADRFSRRIGPEDEES